MSRQSKRFVISLGFLLLALALVWGISGLNHGAPSAPVTSNPVARSTAVGNTAAKPAAQGKDPVSGLAWVAAADLPKEARDTLALIDKGGPYPYPRNDDVTFSNAERILPKKDRGYYKEYTVKTPGSSDRGARRIVTGQGGEFYYTSDHYQSFARISR